MEETLTDILAKIREAEIKLRDRGLSTEDAEAIREVIDLRDAYLSQVGILRAKQFWETAYDLAATIKAGNKVPQISEFLRRFAEHVAKQVLSQVEGGTRLDESVADMVDQVPEMVQPE